MVDKGSVAVLGCGPAGLLVAHAVAQAGLKPTVFSKYQRSPIGGAQFLHTAIPGVTRDDADGEVTFRKVGTPETYAHKVYGSADFPTSWHEYDSGKHDVWNMRMAYNHLWNRYESNIVDYDLTPADAGMLMRRYRAVFSTVPAKVLCMDPDHQFVKQDVDIVYREVDDPVEEDYIEYNGDPETPWYRRSEIFGWLGIEYPPTGVAANLLHSPVRVSKPLCTDCDCLPDIYRFGRYGQWKKAVLIHDAYWQATAVLEKDLG